MDELSLASGFPPVDERQWRGLVEKALKGASLDTLVSRTYDGLELKPLYTRKDEADELGIRAIATERPWDIRQLHAEADAESANAAILDDLQGGVTSVALRLAAPGQNGLRFSFDATFARALQDVSLDTAGVWLEPGAAFSLAGPALLDLLQSVEPVKAKGGLGVDPLGALAVAGRLPVAIEQALDEAAQLARAVQEFPHVTALTVDARPYHNGGASEGQELACLCATTASYLRALNQAGIAPSDAFEGMTFALAADADQFLTMAKLRAARLLLARIAESCEAPNAAIRIHATTSERMLTRRAAYTNLLRNTIACAGAALGGADAITVLPFTWALGQPDDFARRLARNIQIILMEESHLGQVADPAGGSWYVESATRDLARKAWELFQNIEAEGGMAKALESGRVQKMIADTAEKRAANIAQGTEKLTGITSFPNLTEEPLEAEPWPIPEPLSAPAVTVEPIPVRRTAEPFERQLDEKAAGNVSSPRL